MEFSQKKILKVDLFDFTSFLAGNYLNFQAHYGVHSLQMRSFFERTCCKRSPNLRSLASKSFKRKKNTFWKQDQCLTLFYYHTDFCSSPTHECEIFLPLASPPLPTKYRVILNLKNSAYCVCLKRLKSMYFLKFLSSWAALKKPERCTKKKIQKILILVLEQFLLLVFFI